MPIILPKYGLVAPSETTRFRDLGKELREMAQSIEDVLESFDYNGADPGLVLSRVTALEGATPLRGTIAARTAATGVPDGVIWSDTDGARMVWRRIPTGWMLLSRHSWRASKEETMSTAGEKLLNSVTTTGVTIQQGTLVRLRANHVGLYGTVGASSTARWRYAVNSTVSVSSALIPGPSTYRVPSISGNVTTHDFESSFVMPSTGVLSVGFTFEQNLYLDPWFMEVSI